MSLRIGSSFSYEQRQMGWHDWLGELVLWMKLGGTASLDGKACGLAAAPHGACGLRRRGRRGRLRSRHGALDVPGTLTC